MMMPEDATPTNFGDVWFVPGRHGETIPLYSDSLCEYAAIEAFLGGDYGALLSEEIVFYREPPPPLELPFCDFIKTAIKEKNETR